MKPLQELTLSRLRAYLRFALVLHYLNRALEKRGKAEKDEFDADLEELEADIDCAALFDNQTLYSTPSDALAVWFRENRWKGPRRFASAWEAWFLGRSTARARKRKRAPKQDSGVPLPPTLHQIQPFTGNPSPHNMIGQFKYFVEHPDEISRPGREAGIHTVNLAAWERYACNIVETNGGWAEFSRRARSEESETLLIDAWPSRMGAPSEAVSVGHHSSFALRVRALAENRYLQVIVPSVALAWPLWMLKMLSEHRHTKGDAVKRCVELLLQARIFAGEHAHLADLARYCSANEGLYVEWSLGPGKLADLPFPFGAAESVLVKERGSEALASPIWELEWFDPLRKELFDSAEANQWCPPILICHRADAVRGDIGRYIVATNPCPTFASVFATGTVASEYKVGALKGSWGEQACMRMRMVTTGITSRREYFHWTASPDERKKAGLFLGSFPSDVFLREDCVPLNRRELYATSILPDEALDEIVYDLPGMAFYGGTALAGQPRMRPLLTEFGGLLRSCRELVSTCTEGITHRQVKDAAAAPPPSRAERIKQLSEQLMKATDKVVPLDKNRENLMRSLLVQLGQDMGEHLCPPELRDRFNALIAEWGWVNVLELTFYSSITYGHDLLARED